MLVITLGTIASGSTWLFNVVRALMAEAHPEALSLSAGDAGDLLNNVPPGTHDLVLKAHSLDDGILTMASLFDAKIIVTTRDPRDSFVSHRERFGASLHEAAADLTRASATLQRLPADAQILRLRYEDRFMDDPATIPAVSQFLGLPCSEALARHIFDRLRPEALTRKIDSWRPFGRFRQSGFEQATHWHPGHIGDGESGKWQRCLEPDEHEALLSALGSDLSRTDCPATIEWSPKLFTYYDERSATSSERLDCDGSARALVWGPYMHLPVGRWQVRPRVALKSLDQPVSLRIDIYLPSSPREQVALRVVNLPTADERLTMEFDHFNHLEAVEMRISSLAERRCSQCEFKGAELTWLGPSERADVFNSRPVAVV